MGGSSEVKRIDVALHTGGLDTALIHPLDQELGIMDSLRAGQDLFTSHEEVVRVGQCWVRGVGHGVEGSNSEGELVKDVVVGTVLFLDQSTEPSFVLGAVKGRQRIFSQAITTNSPEIIALAQLGAIEVFGAGFLQHLDTIRERKLQGLIQPRELVARELRSNDANLVAVLLLQALEDGQEQRVENVENLVVVLLNGHLEIETGELAQVSMRVGIFGTEDGSNLVHSLHVTSDTHLLRQLRGLRQEGFTLEVGHLEYAGSGFRSRTLQFRRMDLDEAERVELFPEELADGGLDPEDGLVDGRSEIHDSVVQPCVQVDSGKLGVLFGVVGFRPGCLVNAERQSLSNFHDGVDFADLYLACLDRAGLDFGRLDDTFNEDNGFCRNTGSEFHHLLADGVFISLFADGDDPLKGKGLLSQSNECHLGTLSSGVVNSSSNDDRLTFWVLRGRIRCHQRLEGKSRATYNPISACQGYSCGLSAYQSDPEIGEGEAFHSCRRQSPAHARRSAGNPTWMSPDDTHVGLLGGLLLFSGLLLGGSFSSFSGLCSWVIREPSLPDFLVPCPYIDSLAASFSLRLISPLLSGCPFSSSGASFLVASCAAAGAASAGASEVGAGCADGSAVILILE